MMLTSVTPLDPAEPGVGYATSAMLLAEVCSGRGRMCRSVDTGSTKLMCASSQVDGIG